MVDAFYRQDGEGFESSELTTGPWSVEHQHAGPPAALLARELQLLAADMPIVRITYEIMRPVPVAHLNVTSSVSRSGRKVSRFEASLFCEGKELVRATALGIRRKSMRYQQEPAVPPHETMPRPSESTPVTFPFFDSKVGYHTAMELRIGHGGIGQGFASAWLRMKHPLIEGEEPTPLERAAIAADSGNGVSAGLDWRQYVFINPDLTLYIHRFPQGEWIGLRAHSFSRPDGTGIADDQLYDERGPIGRAVQSLYIDEVES